MKKLIVLLTVAALLAASAFAYSNQQKIYPVDSDVYKSMETLYILAGKGLPSSAGPWSEAELRLMLERIDRNSLSEAAGKYYDYVESKITSDPKTRFTDNLAMQFGMDADLELYYHTDTENTKDYNDWFHSFTDREKFLNFTFETWPTDSFYSYFEFSIANGIGKKNDDGKNVMYQNGMTINAPVLNNVLFLKTNNLFFGFDWTFPKRAFVAAGGDHWSIMAGRDKLSWGSGETGNLMLSDSFPAHNMIKFSAFFNAFKYSIVGTIYPFNENVSGQFTSLDGYKSLIVHRLEFNLFENKVGLVINEACMYWSKPDQQFSLAQINPFGFMHNEYVGNNGNSLLVFEADYTPIAGVNAYAQFAMDEFQGPGEPKENPSAFGLLAGVKGAMTIGDGILNGSLEFVKTDPFLYLRGMYGNPAENNGYGFDAIYRSFIMGYAVVNSKQFITYKYGNDVILFDGKVNYEMPDLFKVGFEAMFMKHGSMSIDSPWGTYTGDDDPTPILSTPTTYNVFDENDYDYATHTVKTVHAVEQRIILSLTGEYQIIKGLRANLAADFLIIKNKNNVENADSTDIQLTVGIRYSI